MNVILLGFTQNSLKYSTTLKRTGPVILFLIILNREMLLVYPGADDAITGRWKPQAAADP